MNWIQLRPTISSTALSATSPCTLLRWFLEYRDLAVVERFLWRSLTVGSKTRFLQTFFLNSICLSTILCPIWIQLMYYLFSFSLHSCGRSTTRLTAWSPSTCLLSNKTSWPTGSRKSHPSSSREPLRSFARLVQDLPLVLLPGSGVNMSTSKSPTTTALKRVVLWQSEQYHQWFTRTDKISVVIIDCVV